MDRVLDLLHKVKYEQDGTLTFRRSCAHGVCGSDAMLINGRNRLACKIRVDQLGKRRITVAPLPGLPRHQGPRRRHGRRSSTSSGASSRTSVERHRRPERERLQSAGGARALRRHDQVHPVRRVHDRRARRSGRSRRTSGRRRSSTPTGSSSTRATTAADERLEILADKDGVWRCRTIFNCTDACPRGINITQAILEVSSRDRGAATPERAAGGASARPIARTGRHPDRRRGTWQSRTGVARRRAVSTLAAGCAATPRAARRDDLRGARRSRPTTSPSRPGVVAALELARRLGRGEVDLFLDSKLIVEQLARPLAGQGRSSSSRSTPRRRRCSAGFRRWSATHVPRAQNSTADRLANEALDRVAAGGPMRVARARRVAAEE